MSGASSLLRRRSWRVLSSLLKHRQRELEYLTATSRGNNNAFRSFATGERLAPSLFPRALAQVRRVLVLSTFSPVKQPEFALLCNLKQPFLTKGKSGQVYVILL